MHQNANSVDLQLFCFESFLSPMNVVPCRKELYATPPHIPGGRVTVRASYMHQNARSVDRLLCSESFHCPVKFVNLKNEHYAIPPHSLGRWVTVGSSGMHRNAKSVDLQFCSESFHNPCWSR
ncbi:hypothetical protein TNCT_384151 [Trichonephila clavata]|uniref:Uncharacterized protein n=1 Tax=Trichonephila clavata TaxID=2740835 RepID=A0A8X6FB53_TRICU|nr:hypothetical protein TNCT_384151 [Trichonephila clavata]